MAQNLSRHGGSAPDAGIAAVERLHQKMMIDEEWTARRPRGFTWWGHRLAQHVDASELTPGPDGELRSTVTVRTEVVRGVPSAHAGERRQIVNLANKLEAMSAVVYDEAAGTVEECASAAVGADTVDTWIDVLSVASVLQNAAAHSRANALAASIGGEPATSAHPSSGERLQRDDLLNGPVQWASMLGKPVSRFRGEPMLALERHASQWSVCTGDETGFTGEVPYSGSRSAIELMVAGQSGHRETALVRMFTDQPHPQLGSGVLLRMQLPPVFGPDRGVDEAQRLNALEASGSAPCMLLGAWCEADGELNYIAFVPSVIARPGLLENLFVDCAVRSSWAFGELRT
ncbi:MAG: hypothetical protein ACKO27_04280 [Ilumatobacteraceae bacterium]